MQNCSFTYPSKTLLRTRRALTPEEFELALPPSLMKPFKETFASKTTFGIPIHMPLTTRLGVAATQTIGESQYQDGIMPFPYSLRHQVIPLIGRLAADGVEPYLSQLAPVWQPGDDTLEEAAYISFRDSLTGHKEHTYAELASRYLVCFHTLRIAHEMVSIWEDEDEEIVDEELEKVVLSQGGYAYNKFVADRLEKYLPALCTAWRYVDVVFMAADAESLTKRVVLTDWKAIQKEYGVFQIPS